MSTETIFRSRVKALADSNAPDLKLNVDSSRVIDELTALASLSDCPDPVPAVTRVVFTQADLDARDYLRKLYLDAGLEVRVDAVGNTFARWVGQQPELPAIGTGSHTDAIPFSGMYDGTVGVLGGLEAIRSLQSAQFQPRRSIELLMFTSEEPTRFGVGCTGSRVMAGVMDQAALEKLTDEDGDDYVSVCQRAGFTGEISGAVLPTDYYHAWVELHIEQGPVLEAESIPIGIVTAIAAPATMVVEILGDGGHAGAVLMPVRKDALCGAAEIVHAIERLGVDCSSDDLVVTVGELEVHPGAVNSIPRRVRFTIDLRDIDLKSRDEVKLQIEESVASIAERRGLMATVSTLNQDPPATASQMIIDAALRACDASGLSSLRMVSRAYHDSLFMAQVAPMSMIFIPCRGGVSHRPDEFSTPEQIAAGIEVLARTMAELSRS